METEDIKHNWRRFEKKLDKNLQLNEELLRKLNLSNSKKEVQKIIIYEIINIVIGIGVIIFLLDISIWYLHQLRFSIPGFIAIGATIVTLVFGIIRMKSLRKIKFYSLPVITLQRNILEAKRKTLIFRKYELILLPALLLPFLPILTKYLYNYDLYNNIKLFIIEAFIVIALAYFLVFWIYRFLYDKKFKNVVFLLNELKSFQNE